MRRVVKCKYCNCIVTRVGVYNEILPEPEGNPVGGARGISRGLRQYFIVYGVYGPVLGQLYWTKIFSYCQFEDSAMAALKVH